MSAQDAIHAYCGRTNNYTDKGDQVSQDTMEADRKFVKPQPVAELQYFVCEKKTGCNECKYLAECKPRIVSQYCILMNVVKQDESFHNYK